MNQSKHVIIGSVWFGVIGIVLMHNGFEEKAYIGTGNGYNQAVDENIIMTGGMPFPLKQAKELISRV